jgi:FkbM family methyltransferase
MPINPRLIIDVGMSEGNDTAFYLAKGFDVVGVEADAAMQEQLGRRFSAEIAAGRLHLLHRAAAAQGGERARFFHDEEQQGQSSLNRAGRSRVTESDVETIDWPALRGVAGVPYYMKLDIEGGEAAFLSSIAAEAELPPFISAEVQTFGPIEQFHRLGYTRFRLINQEVVPRIALPDPPREGVLVPKPATHHWSGPFGRELPGPRWFSFDEIKAIHDTIHRLWQFETLISGWMDCHAGRPEAPA